MLEPFQTHEEAIAILDIVVGHLRTLGFPVTEIKNGIDLKVGQIMGLASCDSEVRLVEAYCTILFEKRHKCESYVKFWHDSTETL